MSTIGYCAYLRVSTAKQGRSGLGLDAQQKAVYEHVNGSGSILLAEFTEVESGTRRDRPQLNAALDFCRKHKAILIIAKLDRLARNVSFVSSLLESKIKFIAADMPEADIAFLQMAAVFGEWEARKVSERTCAALAAAKARGRKLGWSNPERSVHQHAAAKRGAKENQRKADQFAANVIPLVDSIRQAGVGTLEGLAAALNARGIQTARGGQWHAATVQRMLARR